MNRFIFLRKRFLYEQTQRNYAGQKQKSFTSQLAACVLLLMKEDKKTYGGKCFQPVRYGDYWNLSNQQTTSENNQVLNAWSICFTPISWIVGRRTELACVFVSIELVFHDRYEQNTIVAFMSLRLGSTKTLSDLEGHKNAKKCDVILGVKVRLSSSKKMCYLLD